MPGLLTCGNGQVGWHFGVVCCVASKAIVRCPLEVCPCCRARRELWGGRPASFPHFSSYCCSTEVSHLYDSRPTSLRKSRLGFIIQSPVTPVLGVWWHFGGGALGVSSHAGSPGEVSGVAKQRRRDAFSSHGLKQRGRTIRHQSFLSRSCFQLFSPFVDSDCLCSNRVSGQLDACWVPRRSSALLSSWRAEEAGNSRTPLPPSFRIFLTQHSVGRKLSLDRKKKKKSNSPSLMVRERKCFHRRGPRWL